MEKNLNLSVELRNAVVNYLAARPFAEVNRLIAALMSLEDVEQPAKAAAK